MRNNVEKWADRHGLKWQHFGKYEAGTFTPSGILISTDYFGEYPPPEVYELHNKIAAYARKTGDEYEPAAMHTGARVYF